MRKRSRLSEIFEARAELGTSSELFYIVAPLRPFRRLDRRRRRGLRKAFL